MHAHIQGNMQKTGIFAGERHLLPILHLRFGGDEGAQKCLCPALPAPDCRVVSFCYNRTIFLEKAAETLTASH